MQEIASALIAGVIVVEERKAEKFLDCYINGHAIYSDFSTISISSSVSPYNS
jgi:hypothetical protein